MVERCCASPRGWPIGSRAADDVAVLNDVVLNQVLVRFGDADAFTRRVIERVQAEGVAWMGADLHGMAAMRISVSNWSTTEADADATVASILRAVEAG